MAGLLLQDRPTELKPVLFLIAICSLVGCSGKPAEGEAAATGKTDPFVEKMKSLPESERAEYARTHAAEAAASVNGGH